MALIQCPDCGNMISENADSCPKCGYSLKSVREREERIREEKRKHDRAMIHLLEFGLLLFALILFFLFASANASQATEETVLNFLTFVSSMWAILPIVIIVGVIILIFKK